MGRGIYFFADKPDNQRLCQFANTIGLRIFRPLSYEVEVPTEEDPSGRPFCYLSAVPTPELHPYGPQKIIGPATDPLLDFLRSYRENEVLVMGRIYWSDDVEVLAKTTRPFFSTLCLWIKKHWEPFGNGRYIGPSARQLVNDGATCVDLPPGLSIFKN